MPLQNRVDPWGNIVAHPAYGMLMGNRGCLHDEAGRIVRTSDRSAWISCLSEWPGIRRELMQPGQYTELFFLDEATALAAGHRPCGSCRKDALHQFKRAWRQAYRLAYEPRVAEIDDVLRAARKLEPVDDLKELPDGTMLTTGEVPLMRWKGHWLAWDFDGYRLSDCAPTGDVVLTTAPFLEVLRAGYQPLVHSSANRCVAAFR